MKKIINWIILIIAVVSLIGNIVLLNKHSATELLKRASAINCERDPNRKYKVLCNGITADGDKFKFSFTMGFDVLYLPYTENQDI